MAKQASLSVAYVIFYVADVEATIDHWSSAYGCKQKFMHESGEYAELDTGTVTIAFAGDALMKQNGVKYRKNRAADGSIGGQVSFVTRDPEHSFTQAVERGARAIKKLERKPWGQTSGLLEDPNGILVEICTPIEHR